MNPDWTTPPSIEVRSPVPSGPDAGLATVPGVDDVETRDALARSKWAPPCDDEEEGNTEADVEVDDELVVRHGEPVMYGIRKGGEEYVKGINEVYWAALYARENVVLYEPDEATFFVYDETTGLYRATTTDFIKQVISQRMLEASRESGALSMLENFRTDRILNAVVSQLRGIMEHRSAFIDRARAVHLGNCMLRFTDDGFQREAFSPEFRSRNRSPIDYDPKANCPRFLYQLLGGAVLPDDIDLLQKMAGQCLLGENLTQRFSIVTGKAGGGKSQFCNVIQALVGRENITQLRTAHLGERFELFRYLRRTLLVGVDVDADFLTSKGAPVIKGLVGGDWFDAEQKGGTGSFQIQGKFNMLMTSNCRLKVKLQGDVGAWRRRMLIVPFEGEPPKLRIPDYGAYLVRKEGPGILNWALDGLLRLLADIRETGDIRLTPQQAGEVDSLLAESDSLRHFLRGNVERSPSADLSVGEIVQAYSRYCPIRGWDPLPESQLTRQLPSLMLELFNEVRANDCKRNGAALRGFRHVDFIGGDDRP